ncbi:MAG: molybdenum cofactor guanylyltransferase [Rhodocyclaceae bacterium]|nr:molybdenum cofactor guanylyltransferase [Rhodocyclaceae bacterium]
MDAPRAQITGLVLAGGQGRRVGGQDKGRMTWGGSPLAEHALARLRPQVGALLVSANRNLAQYAQGGVPVLPDVYAGFQGPLAGLHAGLSDCATPWLVTVACDVPNFPPDLVARLWQGKGDAPAAYAVCGDRAQPTFALYARTLLPTLETFLASGERRLRAWLTTLGAAAVRFDDEAAFVNLNREGDFVAGDAARGGLPNFMRHPIRSPSSP